MLLVNRVLETNSFRGCALKIALTSKYLSAQNALNIVWPPGSARTRWGILQHSLRPPIAGFSKLFPKIFLRSFENQHCRNFFLRSS